MLWGMNISVIAITYTKHTHNIEKNKPSLQSAFFVLVDGPKILLFCFSVFLAAVAYAFLVSLEDFFLFPLDFLSEPSSEDRDFPDFLLFPKMRSKRKHGKKRKIGRKQRKRSQHSRSRRARRKSRRSDYSLPLAFPLFLIVALLQ